MKFKRYAQKWDADDFNAWHKKSVKQILEGLNNLAANWIDGSVNIQNSRDYDMGTLMHRIKDDTDVALGQL